MVGKYVDLTESYKSLSEALIHAGIHTRTKVQHPLRRLGAGRARRHRLRCAAWTRSSCPGGFGKRGVEGKIEAIRYARENGHPVSRHLPRHAARRHRVRAPHGAACRRQQHRVRSATRRIRSSRSITEWQNRDGTIEKRSDELRPGRHDAPGRAAVRGRAGLARAPDLWRDHGRRAPPPSLRGEQPLPAAHRSGGPRRRRAGEERDRRRPLRNDRAAAASVVLRLPVPPRVHVESAPRPSAVHQLRRGGARAQQAGARAVRRRGTAGSSSRA